MIGYVRVSRVAGREGESFQSPEQQRAKIKAWAKLRDAKIIDWQTDLDQSGGKEDRPALQVALREIESGRAAGLAVAKLDRLSRLGVGDALKLVERITNAGGTLAAADGTVDLTTPSGKFQITIMLALAAMERERLTDGWADAQAAAVERGAHVGPTPFGYERRQSGVLTPHASEAPVLHEAYILAASKGAQAALDYLRSEAPHRPWHISMVRRVLGSRTYRGESRRGELVNLTAHEPIVSELEWQAAQTKPETRRAKSDEFPLSALASCSTCGNHMSGSRSKRNKEGESKRAYRCSRSQAYYVAKGERCPKPASILADTLEQYSLLSIVGAIEQDGLPSLTDANAGPVEDVVKLQAELDRAEAELQAFAADQTMRTVLGDSYHAQLVARAETRDNALDRLQRAARDSAVSPILTSHDLTATDIRQLCRTTLSELSVRAGKGPVGERVTMTSKAGAVLGFYPTDDLSQYEPVELAS